MQSAHVVSLSEICCSVQVSVLISSFCEEILSVVSFCAGKLVSDSS